MKTRAAIQALSDANPLPSHGDRQPRRGRMVRAGLIVICSALIMSGAAVGYAQVVGHREVVTTWSSADITKASAQDSDLIDVHDSSITSMLLQLQQRFPLAPGASPEATYVSMRSTLPLDEGSDWPEVKGEFQPFYYLGFVPVDGPSSPPAYVSARDLAGNVAVLAANTWYRYWLHGTPSQRREAEAVIEQMPTWADLVWRVEDGGNPYRVGIVRSMTKTVEAGDEASVRTWFKDRKWLPRPGG